MKLPFTHHGQARTLAKHPKTAQLIKQGLLSEVDAKFRPWYLRFKVGDKERTFKLRAKDEDAISDAKAILNGRLKEPDDFTQFLAARDAKRGSTVGQLAAEWITAGLPFTTAKPRKAEAARTHKETLTRALKWWRDQRWTAIKPNTMEEYVVWRRQHVRAGGFTGNRSADLELNVLSCLGQWALASGRVDTNPFAQRTRFVEPETIRHCHEGMPNDDQQLHAILGQFFADPENKARVIAGAWLAFSALCGLRPGEHAQLVRVPASDRYPASFEHAPAGLIYPMPDGTRQMKVVRLKRGQNPAILIHPALADFLGTYQAWLAVHLPLAADDLAAQPLFPVLADDLRHWLAAACRQVKAHAMKPHGLGRAYYVRVRRSQGADDSMIACELGQSTNGALIRSVYGHPKDPVGGQLHDWLPANPAGKPLDPAWHQLTAAVQNNIIAL